MKSTWRVGDGETVKHVEHFYQPQDNWLAFMAFQKECMYRLIDLLEDDDDILSPIPFITVKVDDNISVRVIRYEDTISVGYKTGAMCSTHADIDLEYSNREYIANKLHGLLTRAPSLFWGYPRRFRVEHQLGLLAYDPAFVSGTIKPNVLTYEFKGSSQMVLSHVATWVGGMRWHPKSFPSNDAITVLDTTARRLLGSNPDSVINNIHIGIKGFDPELCTYETQNIITPAVWHMKRYCNYTVREDRVFLSNLKFHEFLETRREQDGDNKINGLRNHVSRHDSIFEKAFDQIMMYNALSRIILDQALNGRDPMIYIPGLDGKHEGLVFTSDEDKDGMRSVCKMTDRDFVRENFKMWSKK